MREYGLRALAEPAGYPAAAGTQVRGDDHRTTRGTEDQVQRATEMGDGTGQNELLLRGMPEDDNGEQRPLNSHAFNTCIHKGGGGGERVPPT